MASGGYPWAAEAVREAGAAMSGPLEPEEAARLSLLRALSRADIAAHGAAAAEYARYLRDEPLYPGRPEATLGLGIARLGNGSCDAALATLKGGTSSFVDSKVPDRMLFWEGEAAYACDDFSGADRAFRDMLGKYPESPLKGEALYRLAWAEGREGLHEASATHFAEAAAASPALAPSANVQRGWVLLRLKRSSEARVLFGKVAADNPGTPHGREAVTGQAECAYQDGDFAGASKLYDGALAQATDPGTKAALKYSLAWTALRQKQAARARGLFLDVEREYPGEPVAPFAGYRAALCLLDLGKAPDALVELQGVQARYPKHEIGEWSVYSRGWIHLSLGHVDEAKAAFRQLIDSYPNGNLVAPAKYLFGAALYQERHFREAERELAALADGYARSGLADGALLWAGWSALLDGRPADALEHLDRLAREYPGTVWKADAALAEGEAAFAIPDLKRARAAYEAASRAKGDLRLRALTGLGWCAFAAQDWKEAEKRFGMVVAEAPAGAMKLKARVRLADALFNQKRYAEASGHYETAIAGGEEAVARWAQLQLGWCAFRAGDPDRARAQWDQLRRRWPNSPEAPVALHDIGETLFGQERFGEAEDAFRRLSREVPPTSPLAEAAALRVGDCLYNAKSYEAAVLAYREFSVRYPQSKRLIEALYGMQWAYMQLGDYEQARREASSFLAKYPESGMAAEVQQMVAESYRREKKPREAIAEYRELIKKYPDSGLAMSAQMKLGEAQEEAGSFAEAEATYAEFIEKHPGHPLAGDAAFRLAVVRYATGNIEGAVDGFSKIAADPANARAPEALYNLVLCQKKLGREEAMVAAVKQLDEKYPQTRAAAQGHLSAAYFFADAGKRDTAFAQFRAAAESGAGDVASEARYALGDLASQRGDAELALNWYAKGYADLPKGGEWSVQCAFEAANLLAGKKRNDEAVAVLRRVLEKTDAQPAWTATACIGIGQSFEAQGRNEEARGMYAECLRGEPPADLKARAEERLAALGGAPPIQKKPAAQKPAVKAPAVKKPAVKAPAPRKPVKKKGARGG